MKYTHTIQAQFLDRPNRFVAHVAIGSSVETVHVKNTGRCKELLLPGTNVILALSDNPKRKTRYDLISVYKKGIGWINIDSQAPNVVVREWLETRPRTFRNMTMIRPEYVYGNSRVDFYCESGKQKILLEVKGCTLEMDGIGYFPDAPTERGVKHLKELTKAIWDGYECYIAFVIAMPGITQVLPNAETHPEFAEALNEAVKAGVQILNLPCEVGPDYLFIHSLDDGVPRENHHGPLSGACGRGTDEPIQAVNHEKCDF